MCNASSVSASHLAMQLQNKHKGVIERLSGIFRFPQDTAVFQNGGK